MALLRKVFLGILLATAGAALAQPAIIRGNVYDRETGEPVALATVLLAGTGLGTTTDMEGFFSINQVPAGAYQLQVTYLGYDTVRVDLSLDPGAIVYRRLALSAITVQLASVDISGRREQARTETRVATLTVLPAEIRALPATGAEPDLAQYLSVLPGVTQTGDQGGQLYLRGGEPVHNRILLDGVTIFNPFHSIGLFSVFETEAIRSAEVQTAGFNAEYGGRISGIIDVRTREGNKKRLAGMLSASPFQAKALLEGPISKLNPENGRSISFLLTGKHSYLDQSSKIFYGYAADSNFLGFTRQDTTDFVLPYRYTDLYGKISFQGGNGSQLNLFGFNFSDKTAFGAALQTDWATFGGGLDFKIVPSNSNLIIRGGLSFSDYTMELRESDGRPRLSGLSSYTAGLNFSYFGRNNQLDYGFEFHGFNTDFRFQNFLAISFEQQDFTTEISGYLKYKQQLGPLILEPGLRLHYYASQPAMVIEPRLGLKYNITDFLRFKLAGGFYSQNLVGTISELDVVNFFVGFLAGPEETIFEPGTAIPTANRLSKAIHGVAGLEVNLTDRLEFSAESYYKDFTQLVVINRNKTSGAQPDFSTERGEAYGLDLAARYQQSRFYLWLTYSLAYAIRDDGQQRYPTSFDRRHTINLLGTYVFGSQGSWEVAARWTLGSGFPFTQTQGFYQQIAFEEDILTDILSGNYDLGTILADQRNDGRLPWYHRLDFSIRKTFIISQHHRLEVTFSLTNAYNRDNVFYIDRISNSEVYQLPVLPALGVGWRF